MRFALLASFVLATAACTTATEGTGSGEQDQISDSVSITKRPDGSFDVFCRGKDGAADYTQTVSAAQIQDNSVCSQLAPPGPSVIKSSDRTIAVGQSIANAEIAQWGIDLWEGYVSFDIALTGSRASATLIDASGASYALSSSSVRYDRLPVPVRLVASNDYHSASISLTNVTADVTRTIDTAPEAFSGKFSGVNGATKTIASDLPGTSVTLSGNAQFFKNFTNGNGCSQFLLTDATGQTVTLDPSTPTRRNTFLAPVVVTAKSSCVSSRLASPENADADFTFVAERTVFANP